MESEKEKHHRYDPAIHHRRSIRLSGFDYTCQGAYFITLRTAPGINLGTVINQRMALNEKGRALATCWQAIPDHFPHTSLDAYTPMPDHFHGIIRIEQARTGTACRAPTRAPTEAFGKPVSGSIPTIIRSFKAAATRSIREIIGEPDRKIWQRNYYEIIIRESRAFANISAYIRNNPANLNVQRFGELRFTLGNRALLDLPLTAFLASRTAVRARHAVPRPEHKPHAIISGFLSPLERDYFDDCLARQIPMIQILTRGLPAQFPHPIRRAIDAGRLLIMTPFDDDTTTVNAARAAWCNQYALHRAQHILIGHLTPDGMLACLLADLSDDKPIEFLETVSRKASPHEKNTPHREKKSRDSRRQSRLASITKPSAWLARRPAITDVYARTSEFRGDETAVE